jgi:uncharacterized circularly permuted ATP-grasp superfamily protein
MDIAPPLLQRLRLYEALLADAYGPQQALQRGWYEGAALWAHPGYARALLGTTPTLHAISWQFNLQGVQARLQGLPVWPLNGVADVLVLQAHAQDIEAAQLAQICRLPCVPNHALQAEGDALWWLEAPGGPALVKRLLRTCDDFDLDPLDLPSREHHAAAGVPGLVALWCAGRVQLLNAPGVAWLQAPWVEQQHAALCPALLHERALALPSGLQGTAIALREPDGLVNVHWCAP